VRRQFDRWFVVFLAILILVFIVFGSTRRGRSHIRSWRVRAVRSITLYLSVGDFTVWLVAACGSLANAWFAAGGVAALPAASFESTASDVQ
jgi:hypothetical protein